MPDTCPNQVTGRGQEERSRTGFPRWPLKGYVPNTCPKFLRPRVSVQVRRVRRRVLKTATALAPRWIRVPPLFYFYGLRVCRVATRRAVGAITALRLASQTRGNGWCHRATFSNQCQRSRC